MIENTESEKTKFNGLSLILKLFQVSEVSYVLRPICSYTAIIFFLGNGIES